MKIYIPNHLKNLKIVDQLCKIISNYQTPIYYEELDLYKYYYSQLNNDPVKKFIGICLSSEFDSNLEKSENVVNYLTKLFYSVKGCNSEIIRYLKTYIKTINLLTSEFLIGENNQIILNMELSHILDYSKNNEEFFSELFKNFLNSLLIVSEINITIKKVDLEITRKDDCLVQTGAQVYNHVCLEYDETTSSLI